MSNFFHSFKAEIAKTSVPYMGQDISEATVAIKATDQSKCTEFSYNRQAFKLYINHPKKQARHCKYLKWAIKVFQTAGELSLVTRGT